MKTKKALALIVIYAFLFGASAASVFYFRDPAVDLSQYDNVIPEYKEKIKELRIASKLASGYLYGARVSEGIKRLSALAELESPIAKPAKTTLFYYYSQPERYQCQATEACPQRQRKISKAFSEKAFYWARQMAPEDKADALAFLLRDTRIAPLANEADRIFLMQQAEDSNQRNLKAAIALAFHYLDKRYYENDMVAESKMWLDSAAEIEKNY